MDENKQVSILLELIWWKIFTLIFWYKSTLVEHYAGKAEYRMHWTNQCARRAKIYLSRWSESIKYELCFNVKQLMINVHKYYSYDNIWCNTKAISPSLCDCTFVLYLVHIIILILFDYLNTYIKRNVLRFRVINRLSRQAIFKLYFMRSKHERERYGRAYWNICRHTDRHVQSKG